MEVNEQTKDVEAANSAFYANNFTLQVAGRDVFIDFQRLAPRFDFTNPQKRYNVIEHQVIIINTALFKDLINAGSNSIAQLEREFGDITTPEYIQKLSEKQQELLKGMESNKKDENEKLPDYFG